MLITQNSTPAMGQIIHEESHLPKIKLIAKYMVTMLNQQIPAILPYIVLFFFLLGVQESSCKIIEKEPLQILVLIIRYTPIATIDKSMEGAMEASICIAVRASDMIAGIREAIINPQLNILRAWHQMKGWNHSILHT